MTVARILTPLRIVAFASLICVCSTGVKLGHQQAYAAGQEITVYARVFAENPGDTRSRQVLATPTLRVASGRTATAVFGDSAKSIRLEVTPSDLGAGKVALKVAAEVRRSGRIANAAFDVLTGKDTAGSTVVLEDATGAFITDEVGRALFVTFQTPRAGGSAPRAVKPGNGVTWPEVLSESQPQYPEEARRQNLEGKVELEVVVREDGSVGDVRVTKSLDRTYGLDDAAVAAARRWRFKPGLRNGVPVPTIVGLVLEFQNK